jgi:WD40 repeat protein
MGMSCRTILQVLLPTFHFQPSTEPCQEHRAVGTNDICTHISLCFSCCSLADRGGNGVPAFVPCSCLFPAHIIASTLEGHSGDTYSVALSPDGRRVATRSKGEPVRLWDGSTGEHVSTLEGHSGHISSVAFSPDSRRVATGSEDKTVRLWDGSTGEHVSTREGHSGHIYSVKVSPDSHRVATGSSDKTAQLWDGSTGEHVSTLEGHSGDMRSVAFSPDSRRVATGFP